MTERPIIFNAAMVKAILDGRKTQTRRLMKEQPCDPRHPASLFKCPYGKVGDQLWVRENFQPLLADEKTWDDQPYVNYKTGEGYTASYPATDGVIEYLTADDEVKSNVKPSIHMPRWASRIQLEITNIRYEKLQKISEEDAYSEGIKRLYPDKPEENHASICIDGIHCNFNKATECFKCLWESINGEDSWDKNPYVWVVSFKRIDKK